MKDDRRRTTDNGRQTTDFAAEAVPTVVYRLLFVILLALALAWASVAPVIQGREDPGQTATPRPSPSPTRTPLPTWPVIPTRRPDTPTPAPASPDAPTVTGTPPTATPVTPIPTPVPEVAAAGRTINILLLGSDHRGSEHNGRADAIILAILFPDVPAVNLLSIPRDLFVYVPGRGMSRINTAEAYGGVELLKATLRYNLGLRVDYYVQADFEGFKRIVDALGGIDVPVDCRLEDWRADPQNPGQFVPYTLEPGVRHMDGDLALWYVRSRMTTSGFDRDRRQHKVLRAAWHKALQIEAIPKLPELWGALRDSVQTDLTLLDVLRLGAIGLRLDTERIKSRAIGSAQVTPWRTPDGQAVLLPDWERIAPVLRDAFTPGERGAVAGPRVAVELWNGTGVADWPIVAADRLADEGFTAIPGQADRQDYAQTLIVDFGTGSSGALARLRALFHVPPARVIRQPASGSPIPYRVIIGQDFNVCANPGRPLMTPTPTPTATATPTP